MQSRFADTLPRAVGCVQYSNVAVGKHSFRRSPENNAMSQVAKATNTLSTSWATWHIPQHCPWLHHALSTCTTCLSLAYSDVDWDRAAATWPGDVVHPRACSSSNPSPEARHCGTSRRIFGGRNLDRNDCTTFAPTPHTEAPLNKWGCRGNDTRIVHQITTSTRT